MRHFLLTIILVTSCFSSVYALENTIKVTSKSIENGKPISEKYAFCKADGKGKTTNAGNLSPELSWSGFPTETKSFAIVVVDPDVPAKFDDANQDGKIIAEDFPRQNFYHFVRIDIPSLRTFIDDANTDKIIGKTLINDFPSFVKDKPPESFAKYDGPCPPWNDKRLHHYHFTVYALNVTTLETKVKNAKDAISEIEKHAIAKGELVGTYSNYYPVATVIK